MIAVISGATGLVGTSLTQKLLQDPDIQQLVVISRKTLGIKNPKLKEVIVSGLAELPSYQSELRGDLYFCCLGTTIKAAGSQENFRKVDYEAIVEFGKIAKHHQAQSFVLVSAKGANRNSLIFYNQVKGETEEALQELKLKSLVIFRPGLLVGERQEFRLAEKVFIEALKMATPLLPKDLEKNIATKIEDLAEHMVKAGKSAAPGVVVIESKDI